MLGMSFYKADPANFVMKARNGEAVKQGKGLSFFYLSGVHSVIQVPMNTQECPFIFNLQTRDFQDVAVQGQVVYKITEPLRAIQMLNFTLDRKAENYVSEDPLKLKDRINRLVQTLVQTHVQTVTLKEALVLSGELVELIHGQVKEHAELTALGIELSHASIFNISPNSETARALEARAREAILKEADDAIYNRRKSSVEQERMIQEAELQTQLSVQQKEQEIDERRVENERTIFREKAATRQEVLAEEIDQEKKRKDLVVLQVENQKMEADSKAYEVSAQMDAFKVLPVEHLKAMALAQMQPEQLMALAFDSLAQNANKIGELNISPDVLRSLKKAVSP